MEKKTGYYFGTEINEKWWRRYTKDKMFVRGRGEYWFDENGLTFDRYLVNKPVTIPFESIVNVKTGKWHSGRWGRWHKVIKVIWKKGDLRLSSGFILSKDKKEAEKICEFINSKIG